MKYKDYYKILDVDKSASKEDIKKAYRKLAKKYHPDANPGDKTVEEKFKDINEAYEVLSDETKKNQYDNFGQQTHFSGSSEFDPSQYGFGGNSGNTGRYYRSSGDGDFSDFFNMFFGGSSDIDMENIFGSSRQSGSRQYYKGQNGEDQEVPLTITLEEGITGIQKNISIKKDGKVKRLNVKIPMGIRDGEKIRLKGQGRTGINGGKNGDLYLVIQLSQGDFRLEGLDVYITMKLLPWEAALGTKKNIKTIEGTIAVKVPKGIQSGKRIKVARKGYVQKNGNRGDLFIDIQIKNPEKIDEELIKLFEKMKELYSKEV